MFLCYTEFVEFGWSFCVASFGWIGCVAPELTASGFRVSCVCVDTDATSYSRSLSTLVWGIPLSLVVSSLDPSSFSTVSDFD